MKSLINRLRVIVCLVFLGLCLKNQAHAAVTATGLAIIGYDDFADSFSTLALEDIQAGEVIYFTNNGWNSTTGKFFGADPDQAGGNESLIKLTVSQTISRGTVISSTTSGAGWQWTNLGLIPTSGSGTAEFSDLSLDHESDQIYAFQSSSLTDPLLNPSNFLYALYFGSVDYLNFSDAEESLTGNIPPGLSLLAKNAFAHTNPAFHGDADGNHSAWGLNVNDSDVQNLIQNGGTSSQWREVIANSSNWGAVQPSAGTLFATPEPSRAMLFLMGCSAWVLRRRKI
jgi:hypothetical protein